MQIVSKGGKGSDFSHSTLSRELKNLALTYKAMRYYSKRGNEMDRVAFWTNAPNYPVHSFIIDTLRMEMKRTRVAFWANAPNHPVRSYIVDIDETGRYTSAACRHRGHSLRGCYVQHPADLARCQRNATTMRQRVICDTQQRHNETKCVLTGKLCILWLKGHDLNKRTIAACPKRGCG